MGIVFVNRYFHPDHAATAQMLSDLAFHVATGAAPVTVITSRQRLEDPRARLPVRERLHGLCVHRVWTTRFGRDGLVGRLFDYLSFHLSAAARLALTLRPGDTVVAATDPPLMGVTAGWVARLRRARLVNWLHDVFPEAVAALDAGAPAGGPGGAALRGLCRLRDTSLKAASCNVVLGEGMADRVRALGVASGQVRVIHNWSDGERVRPLAHRDNPLRQDLGLDGCVVVSYSGNLGRAHDLSSLAEAGALLSDLDDLRFLIVGGGAGLGPLREAVTRRHLDAFRFVPYQPRDRLVQSLGAADIHLVALRPALEGLVVPSKLYGILAAGRSSVHLGDADGEVGKVLAEGECGLTVPPGDPVALAGALRRLHDDAHLRRRMGRNARAVFMQRFDRPAAMRAWSEVLQ